MNHVRGALALVVIVAVPAHAGVVGVSPVPEPATIGLVATGIGVIGGLAWWRSRKR